MQTTQEHYDKLLGPVYAWMCGDLETAYQPNRQLFEALTLQPGKSKVAIDFGCGHGLQTIPLAELDFQVYALDNCRLLLDELREASASLSPKIEIVCADIAEFTDHVPEEFDLAVCMGDTLTHLPTKASVKELIRNVANRLTPEGHFVVSFRDYFSSELTGAQRFIPVQADENQILTCFLEYDDEIVHVHDVICRRRSGGWGLEVGVYQKLRLDPTWVGEHFLAAGLSIVNQSVERGMTTIVGRASS